MVWRHNLQIGIVFALFLLGCNIATAQVVPEPVQYIVAPETPGPREAVLIEAQGVGSFLGDAEITWTQDGRVIKEGVGERKYVFTTGALGTPTTVRVTIDSNQGTFTQTFRFNPSAINLLWEADTTVPPLYRGKPLYSGGSNFTVVAFPIVYSGSSRVAQTALSYQWARKGVPITDQSGLGRYRLSLTGDQLQAQEDISLDVYYGAQKVAHGELSIPAANPFILLYQRDALRGPLYESALPAGINLIGKELSIQAEPYYFSSGARRTGQLQYAWIINDEEATGPDTARGILTLRQAGSGEGNANVGVSIQNQSSDQFVQAAQTALRIVFGQGGNSLLNFFGL